MQDSIDTDIIKSDGRGLKWREFTPEHSNFIKSAKYSWFNRDGDPVQYTTRITIYFTNGTDIEYTAPESLFNQMIAAPSAGKFYHSDIKNKYEAKKIR